MAVFVDGIERVPDVWRVQKIGEITGRADAETGNSGGENAGNDGDAGGKHHVRPYWKRIDDDCALS